MGIRPAYAIGALTAWMATSGCAPDANPDRGVLRVVTAELRGTIGTVDGPEETLLGRVTSVGADPKGRVYVADALGSTVRAFGSDGEFLSYIGKEGRGPGEFTGPNDVLVGPEGRLYVRDMDRVTTFGSSEEGEIPDSVVWTARIPGYGISWSRRGGTDGERYFYPSGGNSGYFYLIADRAGFGSDTIRVPSAETMRAHRTAFVRTPGRVDGFMVKGLNPAPFEPAAVWDVTGDGSVVFTDASEYVIVETAAQGDTLARWTGPRAKRAVSGAERTDSAAALKARLDSLPVSVSEVRNVSPWVQRGELPDTLPAAIAVHVSPDQKAWVRQWPAPGQGQVSVFDVFDRGGSYLATVMVPEELRTDPPPYVSESWIVGVVVDEITGVEQVLVFETPSLD